MAATDSLKSLQEKLGSMQRSAARQREGVKVLEQKLARKAVIVLNSGVQGAMQHYGVPNGVMGFPWKVGLWGVAQIAEVMLNGGYAQEAAGGIADSTLAIFTHGAIAGGTLIAGDGRDF